jgi:hypothetical protein
LNRRWLDKKKGDQAGMGELEAILMGPLTGPVEMLSEWAYQGSGLVV